MDHNVLIGSMASSFGEHLLEEFSQNATFRIAYETRMNRIVEVVESEKIKICILNFDEITPVEFGLCNAIIKRADHIPVLILGHANEFTQSLIDRHERVHFLQKPVDSMQVRLFASKLLLAKSLPAQRHKRFDTNQEAEIELVGDGDSLWASVRNLSMGGAFCLVNEGEKLSIGALVRLNVHIRNSARRVMNAKVVWKKNHQIEDGHFAFGLKFLKHNEI